MSMFTEEEILKIKEEAREKRTTQDVVSDLRMAFMHNDTVSEQSEKVIADKILTSHLHIQNIEKSKKEVDENNKALLKEQLYSSFVISRFKQVMTVQKQNEAAIIALANDDTVSEPEVFFRSQETSNCLISYCGTVTVGYSKLKQLYDNLGCYRLVYLKVMRDKFEDDYAKSSGWIAEPRKTLETRVGFGQFAGAAAQMVSNKPLSDSDILNIFNNANDSVGKQK